MFKRKMIISIILLILSFIYIQLNTKVYGLDTATIDHYYEIDMGSDEMLYNNGYSYCEGTVNWNKEGCYETIHKTINDEPIVIKNHIIPKVTDDKIKTNSKLINNINVLDNYQFCDVFYLSETNYYVVCNYQEIDYTYYDQETVAILYYENNTLKWYYHYYKYSHFVKGILCGNNLLVSFNIYNESDNFKTTTCLFEITPNKEIIKEKEFKGNEKAEIINSIFYNSSIYLIINTKSSELDFKDLNPTCDNNVIILVLNYNDFKVIDNVIINYNDRIYAKNVYCCLNKLFIFTKNLEDDSMKLIMINMDTGYVESININKNVSVIYQVFTLNNNIYIVLNQLGKNKIIDKTGKEITSLDPFNNLFLLNCDNNRAYFGVIKDEVLSEIIKIEAKKIKKYPVKLDVNNILNIKNTDEGFHVITKNNKNLSCYKFDFLEFIYEKYDNKEDKKLVINGLEIDNYELITSTDKSVFGTYYNYKSYKYDNGLRVCYMITEVVPLTVNVKHHSTYQRGLVLEFNGRGILGNEEIHSGYVCDKIGNYSLEIIGANEQKSIITFTIKDLVVSPIEKEEINIKISNLEFVNKNVKSDVNNTIELIEHNTYSFNVVLFLIIVVLGTSVLIVIERKLKK